MNETTVLTSEVPKQFPSEEQKEIADAISQSLQNTSTAILIITVIGQLFGKQIIKKIWTFFLNL